MAAVVCLDLGHYGITNCDFVAYMPKLRYLLLGDTWVKDLSPLEGLDELVYLEIFMTSVTDYTPLLKLSNLEFLNLCFTNGQVDVIAQLTWVDYIRWGNVSRDYPNPDQQAYLQECLPDTVLEFGPGVSSTGGMWRQHQHYFDMRDLLGRDYMVG